MQSQNLKVFNHISYIGHFGNMLGPMNSDSLLLPFRSEKEMEEHTNNEFALIKYLTNCVLLGQKIISICFSLNLSNISSLPKISLCNVADSNNVLMKSSNPTANLNVSLINQLLFNPKILCVLKEFGVIFNKHCNDIQSIMDNNVMEKKRHAPDFEDYHVIPSKRIKLCTNQKETDNDFDIPQQDCKQTETSGNQRGLQPFEVIINKWNVNRIADPHINHTHCAHIPTSLYHNHWNQTCIWQDQSCLLSYDQEIAELDITLSTISESISGLHKLYNMTRSFGFSCKINDKLWQLQQRENTLQNKYAALCDSRDEIYRLYVDNKQEQLTFDAPFISINDINTVKINRQMLNNFSYHYPA